MKTDAPNFRCMCLLNPNNQLMYCMINFLGFRPVWYMMNERYVVVGSSGSRLTGLVMTWRHACQHWLMWDPMWSPVFFSRVFYDVGAASWIVCRRLSSSPSDECKQCFTVVRFSESSSWALNYITISQRVEFWQQCINISLKFSYHVTKFLQIHSQSSPAYQVLRWLQSFWKIPKIHVTWTFLLVFL